MNPWCRTRSGKSIDFLNPDPGQIELGDVAFGLATEPRWGAQVRDFPIATHSMLVAILVIAQIPHRADPRPYVRRALTHDAHEFIAKDVPSPLKSLLPELAAIHDRLQDAIDVRFGISRYAEVDALVHRCDSQAQWLEHEQLFDVPSERQWKPPTRPPASFDGYRLERMDAETAELLFLQWCHDWEIGTPPCYCPGDDPFCPRHSG